MKRTINYRYFDEAFSEARCLASTSSSGIISSDDLGVSRGRYLVKYDALRIVSRKVSNGRVVEEYKLSEYGVQTVRECA